MKIWSSESDSIRISLILMSQCGGTSFWSHRDLTDDVLSMGFCFTERSEVLGNGIDVISIPIPTPVQTSIPVPAVPVLMSHRTYERSRYRYWCRTEHTEVSAAGIDAGLYLSQWPLTILRLYRTYRSVRCRYWCHTELTEVSGTGIDVVPNVTTFPVPVLVWLTLEKLRT